MSLSKLTQALSVLLIFSSVTQAVDTSSAPTHADSGFMQRTAGVLEMVVGVGCLASTAQSLKAPPSTRRMLSSSQRNGLVSFISGPFAQGVLGVTFLWDGATRVYETFPNVSLNSVLHQWNSFATVLEESDAKTWYESDDALFMLIDDDLDY